MKKLFYFLIAMVLCVASFGVVACNQPQIQADKINVKYYATPADIVPLILSGKESVGLIPEPAATALQNNALKQGKTLYRLDLQQLYDSQEMAYPQAVLMVKKSVLGANEGLSAVLEQKITDSVDWAKQNISQAVTAISTHGVTTLKAPALSPQVIDACKIYWQDAQSAKQSVKNYIDGIIQIDSAKANAVSDDFFYSSSSLTNEKQSYTFIAPDGAPAIAISKLMHDSDDLGTGKSVSYSVLDASLISNALVKGEADFILAPVNLASKLYAQHDATDHYVMVAVVTHGNFYIISTEQLSVKDLSGKQVAVPMMGAVPDWTFQMVLKKHNLSYTVVE